MHLHHPGADCTFAMDINGKNAIDSILAADLIDEAAAWPLPRRRAISAVGQTLAQLAEALDSIDTTAYSGVPDQAWEVVRQRTRQMLSDVPPIEPAIAPQSRRRDASAQPRVPRGKPGGGQFTG